MAGGIKHAGLPMATGIGTCRANRSHVCNSGRKESMLWRAAYSMQE